MAEAKDARAMLEQLLEAIMAKDQATRMLHVNPPWRQMAGVNSIRTPAELDELVNENPDDPKLAASRDMAWYAISVTSETFKFDDMPAAVRDPIRQTMRILGAEKFLDKKFERDEDSGRLAKAFIDHLSEFILTGDKEEHETVQEGIQITCMATMAMLGYQVLRAGHEEVGLRENDALHGMVMMAREAVRTERDDDAKFGNFIDYVLERHNSADELRRRILINPEQLVTDGLRGLREEKTLNEDLYKEAQRYVRYYDRKRAEAEVDS